MDDAGAFKILADPQRRAIVERLALGPATVRQLTDVLGIAQPTVSHHLRLMREAQMVAFDPSGASNVYRIDPAGLGRARAWLDRYWAESLAAHAELVPEAK